MLNGHMPLAREQNIVQSMERTMLLMSIHDALCDVVLYNISP